MSISKRSSKLATGRAGPDFSIEIAELGQIDGCIAGADEAGRGPLAGPVVAAAVAFTAEDLREGLPAHLAGLNDSKCVKPELREELAKEITERHPTAIAVGDVTRIDRDNILNATLWAMKEAVDRLQVQPEAVLVDGNRLPELDIRARSVVGGDSRCISIAAASIVAKVHRDRMMLAISEQHPEFGFEKHKGYGTRQHLAALNMFGPTPYHRRSFRPVRLALESRHNARHGDASMEPGCS